MAQKPYTVWSLAKALGSDHQNPSGGFRRFAGKGGPGLLSSKSHKATTFRFRVWGFGGLRVYKGFRGLGVYRLIIELWRFIGLFAGKVWGLGV